jgi:type IV secretory pathway ATPase VirB11/archaellum biosynthesis ATPase
MQLDHYFKTEREVIETTQGSRASDFLTCNCMDCKYSIKKQSVLLNPICLSHILKILDRIENKKIETIKFKTMWGIQKIKKAQIDILKEFSGKISKLFSNIDVDTLIPLKSSCEKFNECKKRTANLINRTFGNFLDDGKIFHDPINSYKELLLELSLYSENYAEKDCKSCLREYITCIENIINTLEKTYLIQEYNRYKEINKYQQGSNLLHLILNYQSDLNQDFEEENYEIRELLNEYEISPFKITIFNLKDQIENLYNTKYALTDEETEIMSDYLENALNQWEYDKLNPEFSRLNNHLKKKINYLEKIINHDFKSIDDYRRENLILQALFKSTGFPQLFCFLIDDNIEEIFLDRIENPIYIDHREYGRCKTNVFLTKDKIERFITRVRMESNLPLDEMNPSLKAEIITDFFQIRVTLIINPLATDNRILIIRKLRKKNFSILELIKNRTISKEVAAYLIFQLFHKRNIIVIGAPGSGKTTLINALDIITPAHWRKIYIEDIIESIDQKSDKHQLRISTKSLTRTEESYYTKESQVRESLHRTPDMIYLGEMISKSSIRAFFFLLKVGLRCGLCTSHGENPELMIKRWMIDDGISINSIQDIDIIVQISKINDIDKIKRRVIRVSEVDIDENNNFKLIDLFIRDPANDSLLNNFESWENLFEYSPVIKNIVDSKLEFLSLDSFLNEINTYLEIINHLESNGKLDGGLLNKYLNKFLIYKKNHNKFDWDDLKDMLLN